MRKLARSVAKHRMQEQGYTKFCKRPVGINPMTGTSEKQPSQFSKVWREFAGIQPPIAKNKIKNQKKHRKQNMFEKLMNIKR